MSFNTSDPKTAQRPASPARSPLVIVLAVLCALLIAGIFFLLGRMGAMQAAQPTETAGASAAPTATATPEKDPEVLKLIRAQPTREEGDPYAQGKVDAPVVMVEYSDFSCPFCAQFANTTKPELKKLIDDGTLRIEWRDLALFPEGKTTGAAARAAADQGKFWEFHDVVFKAHSGGHPSYTEDEYVEFAKQAGVEDLDKFREAIKNPELEKKVFENTDSAIRTLGLRGTPAFIINDEVVSGAQPTEHFQQVIQQELAKVNANK
ncbi:hypothetical protein BSZ39_07615 [Bowdeniella nasicola]|uniref:Thioredoxin domain-containing protein n=1 Tax=Bowdeniella nasicola TaxID=208480 RepID=A0A1Q5Q1N7_9ACTO|nr:thioredoxin domain-containing protein [Bowdeniella nasicola]OKL53784.1 hypothetical protein BSZ39_07615 [Bowdeniella nasicola]